MHRTLKKTTSAMLLLGPSCATAIRAAETASQTIAPTDAADVCPVKIGSRLPTLSLTDVQGKAFDLNALVAKSQRCRCFIAAVGARPAIRS